MHNFASIILMGGKNKRMNGEHKAFLPFGDKTFLEQIISQLSPLGPVYLSVNDRQKYSDLHYPLIEDLHSDIGPMGGIYSALRDTKEAILFITACDMPFIHTDFVTYLYTQLDEESSYVVCSDRDGFLCPLGGIYRHEILPLLESHIKEANYRLMALLKKTKGKVIPFDTSPFSEDVLQNINTPDAYKALFQKE